MAASVSSSKTAPASEVRGQRGAGYGGASGTDHTYELHASARNQGAPTYQHSNVGFRVVQIPEPSTLSLLFLGGLAVLQRRRR